MGDEGFESRFGRKLTTFADARVRPIDPHELAARIAAPERASSGRIALRWPVARTRWLLVAAALVALALVGVAFVGSRLGPEIRLGPLAFIRDGDLWAAQADGSAAREIGSASDPQHAYLSADWSPDGRYLAAVRNVGDVYLVPAIELFDRHGHRLLAKTREPGGLPELSWAPDGRRIAIAEFPTTAPVDGELLAPQLRDAITPMTLSILNLNGREQRLLRAAAPPFSRPPDPYYPGSVERWIRWSPTSNTIALRALDQTCCAPVLWAISADGADRRIIVSPDDGVTPVWFDWRPVGDAIDVVGLGADDTCQAFGLGAPCVSGFWTYDLGAGGSLTATTLRRDPGGAPLSDSAVQPIVWTPDGARAAIALLRLADPTLPPGSADSPRPDLSDGWSTIELLDPATGTATVLSEGSWHGFGRGGPIDLAGEAVTSHAMEWDPGGTVLYRLSWSGDPARLMIRAGRIDSSDPPAPIMDAVTQFDLASQP